MLLKSPHYREVRTILGVFLEHFSPTLVEQKKILPENDNATFIVNLSGSRY